MSRTTFSEAEEHRPLLRAIARGFVGRCPSCGETKLFRQWLKPVDQCDTCRTDFTGQRADDLPPYLVIFVVGHIVVAGYMMTETAPLAWWVQLIFWSAVTLGMSIALLQPFKGAAIGLQWANRMHGFGEDEPGSDD